VVTTWRRAAVHLALAASLGGNIALALYGARASAQLAALTKRPVAVVGMTVPELDLRTADARPVHIKYADLATPTVLYLVAPTCRWCLRNRSSIASLAHTLGSRARFVGVSVLATDPKAYATFVRSEELPFPIYSGLSEAGARKLRVRSTPTTIVVSSAGVVVRVWEGAFSGLTKTQIEQFFGVQLPELPPFEQFDGGL
jgi:hypothetical protein